MATKLSFRALQAVILLFCVSSVGHSQANDVIMAKPTSYTTKSAPIRAMLKKNGLETVSIQGQLTFTVSSANADDTMTGTVTYILSTDARQQIARFTGQSLAEIPKHLSQEQVIAGFEKGAGPPIINLVIKSFDIAFLDTKLTYSDFDIGVNARDGSRTVYTSEEIEALITVWARQINTNRPRVGIIHRLNKAIKGEK